MRNSIRSSLAVAALALLAAAGPVGADVVPGDVITKANVDKVKDLVSPGMDWCVQHGLPMTIVETKPIGCEARLQGGDREVRRAGEARRPTASRSQNYVAGQPFPNVDTDGSAGRRRRSCGTTTSDSPSTDDVDLRNFDADTGPISDGPADAGRAPLPARPLPPPLLRRPPLRRSEARDAEHRRLRVQGDAAPADRAVRPEGRRLHLLPLHRSRRSRTTPGSTCRRSAACAASPPRSAPTRSSARTPTSTATAATPATSPGWTGSSSARRRCSARSTRTHFPVKWAEGAADWAFDDVWEKRKVYVVEGVSKLPQYAYSKRVLFIDKEICAIPYSDMYDRAGELWKIWINNFTLRQGGVPGRQASSTTRTRRSSRRSSWSTCSSSTPPRRRCRATASRASRAGTVTRARRPARPRTSSRSPS